MKIGIKLSFILLLIASLTGFIQAQSLSMRAANRAFNNMQYAVAIPIYEEVLKKKPKMKEAKIKLAESYRHVKDIKNAERMYAQLVHDDNPSTEHIWHYAQILAQDDKYGEALQWYTQYAEMAPGDQKGIEFRDAYKNLANFYKDSASYKVNYLPSVNTWQSDFSPCFYKRGIIFCSNRKQSSVVRDVFSYDNTSFLDLYYMTDTAALQNELDNTLKLTTYTVNHHKPTNNDHSIFTSNDSNTPVDYDKHSKFDSIRYQSKSSVVIRPLNKSANKKYHEGPIAFFKGQDTVIYTRSSPYKKGSNNISYLSLYTASIVNGEWKNEKKLPFNGNNYSTGHPSFTPDNKRLYFASNIPGGLGGTDIYYADYDNGVWSPPVNVKEINTTEDEMFPYAGTEGKLYFSTNGHPGLGGLDIFSVELVDGKMKSLNNVGTPINSSKDDFGIIFDRSNQNGYFSSNRQRGYADDNIYHFSKPCRKIDIYVYDSLTEQPLANASVSIGLQQHTTDNKGFTSFCTALAENELNISKNDYENQQFNASASTNKIPLSPLRFGVHGRVLSKEDKSPMRNVKVQLVNNDDKSTIEVTTANDGSYTFPLELNSAYKVVASKNNCGTNSSEVSTKSRTKSANWNEDIYLLCAGDVVKIDNIYYDFNKYFIRTDAAVELDKLAIEMWKYPDMRIEVRSHTDSRSTNASNLKLSTLRAQAVVDYLATKGIVSSRMRAAGYGESLPINKCVDGVTCTEDEYQQNRRTEFKVLSIK